jgi:L-malate glycosyltransferase
VPELGENERTVVIEPPPPRIRVAFCEDRYHSLYGAQRQLLNLAKNLPLERFDVRMLTTHEGAFAECCREAKVPVDVLAIGDVANHYGGVILGYGLSERIRLAAELGRYNVAFWRWLRQNRIDVVVSNGVRLTLGVGLGTRAARIPFLVYVQGEVKLPWLTAVNAILCDGMMLVASVLGEELPRGLRQLEGHKLATLNIGFRLEPLEAARARGRALRERWSLPEGACAIGLVGSITSRKGADVLLDAAPAILREIPEAYFVLVGDNPPGHEAFLAKLREQVSACGLEPRWLSPGFQTDMAAAYGALDLCVLPSRSEGLPGVSIESLGYGLPCVATDVGGIRDVILDPRFGRVVPPEDPDALAREVVALWRAEPADGSLVLERAAWSRAAFSTERYVDTFVQIVDDLLLRKRRPRALSLRTT